jgi:hypothetical protein
MKEHVDKMLEITVSGFIQDRIQNLEKAINSNNFGYTRRAD